MTLALVIASCALISYLVGSFNPAIFLSKRIYGKDIRSEGSGNPGFTNFKRVFGGKWAWLVMTLDLLKTAVVCIAFGLLFSSELGSFQLGAAAAGVFAIIGHSFPVLYGFKGGKGFLAAASAIWFIDWRIGLILTGVILVLILVSHYMSLSVILTVICAPLLLLAFGYDSPWVLACVIFSSVFVVLRHWPNIIRLAKREERRFYFSSKKD